MTETVIKRFLLLDRSAADAWSLLTDKAPLEAWFCDHATLEARPGGRFDFAGKAVVGGDVQTRFDRFERGEALSFTWPLFGAATAVVWTLERQLGMARVVVEHRARSTPEMAFTDFSGHAALATRNKICIEDIWWNRLAALKYLVETGKAPHKPDLTVTPGDRVVQTLTVDAPAAAAFAALTEAEGLNAWMGQNAQPSLRPGEKFDIGWKSGPQEVTRFEPGKRIAYAWTYENEPRTEVEWSVEGDGPRSRIKLVHSGFGDLAATFNDYNRGWAGFLVRLALYLEKGIAGMDWCGQVTP
jgi:uncharacterized protein YndB with AHSA1/START domain